MLTDSDFSDLLHENRWQLCVVCNKDSQYFLLKYVKQTKIVTNRQKFKKFIIIIMIIKSTL